MRKLRIASLVAILTFGASSAYAAPTIAPPPSDTPHLKRILNNVSTGQFAVVSDSGGNVRV